MKKIVFMLSLALCSHESSIEAATVLLKKPIKWLKDIARDGWKDYLQAEKFTQQAAECTQQAAGDQSAEADYNRWAAESIKRATECEQIENQSTQEAAKYTQEAAKSEEEAAKYTQAAEGCTQLAAKHTKKAALNKRLAAKHTKKAKVNTQEAAANEELAAQCTKLAAKCTGWAEEDTQKAAKYTQAAVECTQQSQTPIKFLERHCCTATLGTLAAAELLAYLIYFRPDQNDDEASKTFWQQFKSFIKMQKPSDWKMALAIVAQLGAGWFADHKLYQSVRLKAGLH